MGMISDLIRVYIIKESINIGDRFKNMPLFKTNENNPFKEKKDYIVEVIDISGKYVKYRNIFGTEDSYDKTTFRLNYKKI